VLVDRIGGGAGVLVGRVRVEEQPVQVGVERRELVGVGALDGDGAELAVPLRAAVVTDGVE
jgi:hypothetical protein